MLSRMMKDKKKQKYLMDGLIKFREEELFFVKTSFYRTITFWRIKIDDEKNDDDDNK